MRALIQRVSQAQVEVEKQVIGSINNGLLIFLGVAPLDTAKQAAWIANKLLGLRIFTDEDGKMNRSLLDIQGEALVVSQFTLYANCDKGKRPSFTQTASPDRALELYEEFINLRRKTSSF